MKRFARLIFWFLVTLLGLLLGGFLVFQASAEPIKGKYSAEITQCLEAVKNGQPRSIENFVCPEWMSYTQDIAYQVILDLEFQKIDKEVKQALVEFQKDKSKNVIAMNEKIKNWFDLTSKNPVFLKRYLKVCSDISTPGNPLNEAVQAFTGGVRTDGDTAKFVQGSNTCNAFAQSKVDAFRDISLLIATGNVVQSYSDDKEVFTGKLKEQYERFLNEWMIYIGELARIKDKWPSKTKIQNN